MTFQIVSSPSLNNAVTGTRVDDKNVRVVGEVARFELVHEVIVNHVVDNQLQGIHSFYDKGVLVTQWKNPIGTTIYIAAAHKANGS